MEAINQSFWQRLTDTYRRAVVTLGAALFLYAVYHLPLQRLDFRLVLLFLITVLVSSRVSVQIPRINATVTVSDTFIFLTLLLYGVETAVVLAAVEGVFAGLRLSKRALTVLCNAGALVCATFISATAVRLFFGSEQGFHEQPLSIAVPLICVLALAQYAAHTWIGAAYLALKHCESIWSVWSRNYLWSSITYFVGAFLAAGIVRLEQVVGFYSLMFPLPVVAVVYLSYQKYLEDVRATSALAERAERERAEAEHRRAEVERERAEQAEQHVKELNLYIAKLESAQAELEESKDHFRHAAFHDSLTELPNRLLFADHLELAIARTRRQDDYAFAVLFLDIDRFKNINDSLGHTYGDALLVEIARRLGSCVRQSDTVARFGGDEFAILLDGITNPADAVRVAEKIQRELRAPFSLHQHEAVTSASIGIALSCTGYVNPEDALRDADTAMYRAKESGKARYEIFDHTMHTRAVALLRLEGDLRRAIERQEFRVYYQPIIELKTGDLAGFEALVRWEHPDRGMVSPDDFIPVAEETGLIIPLGMLVLEEACRQLYEWQQLSPKNRMLTMSVNLSGKQMAQRDLVEKVEEVLLRTGLAPRSLKLEITESVVMENAETATVILSKLREQGIGLSIDDFGTGYSSLSYLHRFPVNTLKIDRSFIGRMAEGDENMEIVRTVITLAQNLGMDVIAEGIETAEQLAQLKALKCEYGQGYFFSQPLKAVEAGAFLLGKPAPASNPVQGAHTDMVGAPLGSPLVM